MNSSLRMWTGTWDGTYLPILLCHASPSLKRMKRKLSQLGSSKTLEKVRTSPSWCLDSFLFLDALSLVSSNATVKLLNLESPTFSFWPMTGMAEEKQAHSLRTSALEVPSRRITLPLEMLLVLEPKSLLRWPRLSLDPETLSVLQARPSPSSFPSLKPFSVMEWLRSSTSEEI